MPTDPTPANADTPSAKPAPKKQTAAEAAEGNYDQAQLQTVKNGEQIATSASADYNPALLEEGMRPTAPADLTAAGKDWRRLSQEALDATQATEQAVDTGGDAATVLLRTVEYIRSKARLKITQNPTWTRTAIDALKKRYFIGEDIFANEETAGQAVEDILDHAAADRLPGITPAKLQTYRDNLGAFSGNPLSKDTQQSVATQKRNARDAKFTEIMRLRHEIQHSADTAWPWYDPMSPGPRALFKLPAGRPFTG